ncbi:MAG: redoxin domain-containing protein [Gemmatimonadetes bacterium]|nr:redoxin domain-containing protein [Gemmatimonadota bacterium]
MIEAPPLPAGTPAPDFTLSASDGSVVSLARVLEQGGVVLAFYPGNHTQMCDRQLREMKEELAQFRAAGVTPFGVNPASVEEHREYAASLGLPFQLLSDPGLEVAKRWHAVSPLGDQVTRTVYLVDRTGTIRFSARGMPGAEITLVALAEA